MKRREARDGQTKRVVEFMADLAEDAGHAVDVVDLGRHDRTPSAFLSVSLSAAQDSKRAEARGYVEDLLAETGWTPARTGLAAGALRYTSYGFFRRSMMKKLAADGGLPTDTSRDPELTDWADVWAFTETFLQSVPAPQRRAHAGTRRAS